MGIVVYALVRVLQDFFHQPLGRQFPYVRTLIWDYPTYP